MAERSDLQENRLKSVENAIAQIQRQYGRGAIMRLGTNERENIPVISTGVLSLELLFRFLHLCFPQVSSFRYLHHLHP